MIVLVLIFNLTFSKEFNSDNHFVESSDTVTSDLWHTARSGPGPAAAAAAGPGGRTVTVWLACNDISRPLQIRKLTDGGTQV